MTEKQKMKRHRLATLALSGLVLMMAGCQSEMSDMDSYFQEVKARRSGDIEPLPQIKTYQQFAYLSKGRRSPFQPDNKVEHAAQSASDVPPPDAHRAREPLEVFPLEGLRMVGTLTVRGVQWALIRDGEGVVHRVSIGNHMGQNFGKITQIQESEIQLKEKIPDGMGGWAERDATVALSE